MENPFFLHALVGSKRYSTLFTTSFFFLRIWPRTKVNFNNNGIITFVKRKRERESCHPLCAICNLQCNLQCEENIKKLTDEQWSDFQDLSKEWERVGGNFGHVYNNIQWEKGATNSDHYWHKNCKWMMANKRKLRQATDSYNKSISLSAECSESSGEDVMMTRQSTGIIHDRQTCIWCMKGDNDKHPELNDFRYIEQMETWLKFKASVRDICN